MSKISLHPSNCLPIIFLKNLYLKKSPIFEKQLHNEESLISFDQENKVNVPMIIPEAKKSYFEITSVENRKIVSRVNEDASSLTKIKRVIMNKIHGSTNGRWNISDYKIPEFELDETCENGVEFAVEKQEVIWSFFTPSLTSVQLQNVVDKDMEHKPRFIVTATKVESPKDLFAIKSNSKSENEFPLESQQLLNLCLKEFDKKSPSRGSTITISNCPSLSYNSSITNIDSKGISPTKIALAKPTLEESLQTSVDRLIDKKTSKISTKLSWERSEILNENVSNQTIQIQESAATPNLDNSKFENLTNQQPTKLLNILIDKESQMSSHPDLSKIQISAEGKATEPVSNILIRANSENRVVDFQGFSMDDLTPSPLIADSNSRTTISAGHDRINQPNNFYPENDMTNRTLEILSKTSASTISVMSSQVTTLRDHVLELNSYISHMRSENESLKHELSKIRNYSRPVSLYSAEIVRSEEVPVSLVVEIIPGVRRVINLMRFLTTDELEYINSQRRQ